MSPRLVLSFIRRLPDTSLFHAFQQGGWEHFGWGTDRHIAADQYDAISFNTEATGHWKKRPNIPMWPRPKVDTTPDSEKPKSRLAEIFKMLGGTGRH